MSIFDETDDTLHMNLEILIIVTFLPYQANLWLASLNGVKLGSRQKTPPNPKTLSAHVVDINQE